MNHSHRNLATLFILLVALLSMPLAAAARPSTSIRANRTAETVIIVNSGTDPDTSGSSTCKNATPCTLRRAIVEANKTKAAKRPVYIDFDIPEKDSEGYDAGLDIWRINLKAGPGSASLPTLKGGNISIDGDTQLGGREEGPKIILVGSGVGDQDGIIIGESAGGSDDFVDIFGLGFVNFRNHLVLNSSQNNVSYNWFGLAADGKSAFLRGGSAAKGSGSTAIDINSGTVDNTVATNSFLGLNEVAVALRGERALVVENTVGLNAMGVVPNRPTDSSKICTADDWLGGGGFKVEGSEHEVSINTFAVLRYENGGTAAQPDAITASGSDHYIDSNNIGLDLDFEEVGTCGRGIRLNNVQLSYVTSNTIADSGLSAISLSGAQYDAVILSDNVIARKTPWPSNGTDEDAIQLDPSLPAAFRSFVPAEIVSIEGTKVSGKSGSGSPCPNCFIELFLDDDDGVTEALELLAEITADDSGNWQAELPASLSTNSGLRTTSSSAADGTIPSLGSDTTTGLSELYINDAPNPLIHLPVILGN